MRSRARNALNILPAFKEIGSESETEDALSESETEDFLVEEISHESAKEVDGGEEEEPCITAKLGQSYAQ